MMKKCGCKNFVVKVAGVLFLFAGISKLFMMTPGGVAEGMLVPVLGIGSGLGLFLAWVLIVIETLGGIALLARRKFSRGLFKTLMIGLIIILAVAIITLHLPGEDYMSAFKDLVLISILASTLCPCRGKKCCSDENCKDGMCKVENTPENAEEM